MAGDSMRRGDEAKPGWRKWLLLLLLLLVVLWAVLKFPDFSARAELASAYAAHAGCACHYIESRPIDSCEADKEAAAWMVSMELDETDRSVTGTVPLLSSRTAHYRQGWGCQLDAAD